MTAPPPGPTLVRIERLSLPLSELGAHYDVVVVGSGYGGGIAASRLARMGRRVCVLERGRELHPGQYPSSPLSASHELQVHTEHGRIGAPTALLDLHTSADLSVLVGCGLGGTSLINANVSLQPDERIFDDERWPEALRGGRDEDLRRGYEAARTMLGPTPLPGPSPTKLTALERSAEALGQPCTRPPLNITFTAGVNAAGVFQEACTHCGNCVSGCNVGAKNTVLMNYLPDARNHGAEIFTEARVTGLAPDPQGGWRVTLAPTTGDRRRFDGPDLFVTAEVVVLAAGSLGSTEILMRAAAMGLPLSRRLGHHFTGNGDMLGFAYDADGAVNGIGEGARRRPDEPPGPCITGAITVNDPDRVDRSLLIEDGVVPGALGPLLPAMLALTDALDSDPEEAPARPERRRRMLGAAAQGVAAGVAGMAAGPYKGPTSRTQTFLVMSTDDDAGRLVLERDGIRVRWPDVGSRPVFRHDSADLRTAAHGIGARLVVDPLWTSAFHHSLVTVHPLGGCVMADDASRGVVDHKGRVFSGPRGQDVHEGLYVLDGAIVPRPLGVNPLLTISALAERGCALLARDRGWTASEPAMAPEPAMASEPAMAPERTPARAASGGGVRFTESMKGWVAGGAADYGTGWERGRAEGSPMEFLLTITIDDLDALAADSSRVARIEGTVTAPALSSRRLMVTDGRFQLLVPMPDEVDTWQMRYRMELRSEEGRRYRFEGHKVVHHDRHADMWPDTTTLYTTVRDEGDEVVARGILRIGMTDLLRQLSTMRATGSRSRTDGTRQVARFTRMFLGALAGIYGGPFDEAAAFLEDPPPVPARPLRLPDPEVVWCHEGGRWDGQDGPDTWLRLTRYQGGTRGPVMVAPGFGMSTAAFVLDTIDTNLTEFLVARGYDVWLFDYRASTDLPSARSDFTLDDVARTDWPTAVEEVRARTGAASVQVVAHCMGSMTFQMAMLAGMQGGRSAVMSQVTVHPVTSRFNRAKTALGVGRLMQGMGLRTIQPDARRTFGDEVLDQVLRLTPIPREERCGRAVCRWISAFYGPTHHHAQLNQATHDAIGRLFGVADLTALDHISLCVNRGRAVDHEGRDTYLGHPERLAIPLMFMAGTHNRIFFPQTSERTYQWLRRHNDPELYERMVMPDYAHLDGFVGRRAAEEVFPRIAEHLDRFNPGRPVDVTERRQVEGHGGETFDLTAETPVPPAGA